MEFKKTSSKSSDNTEGPKSKNATNIEDEVAKFYATIATVSRNMRKDDWTYLRRHPEIRAIIRVIVTEAIKAKPSNIYSFSADLFHVANEKDLVEKINVQLKLVNEQMTGEAPDGNMAFPDSSENSSEGNRCPPINLNAANQKTDENVKLLCPENYKPSCK